MLLQLPCGWRCSRQVTSSDGITLHLHGKRKTAQIPNALSVVTLFIVITGIGYNIYPAQGRRYDLYFPSVTGTAVTRPAHVKFLPGRLPPLLAHSQRSSQVLRNLQHQLGLIAGGEAGKQAATAAGLRCSANTLLRGVIDTPEMKQSGTPHIGIDERARHQGHHYDTLIVDLDTRHLPVLLPGCDQSTLVTWFRKYPEIQVISRDCGEVYVITTCEGTPQTRQIADRWRLLENADDAPE